MRNAVSGPIIAGVIVAVVIIAALVGWLALSGDRSGKKPELHDSQIKTMYGPPAGNGAPNAGGGK